MKRIFFGVLLSFFSAISIAQITAGDTAKYLSGHYRERMAAFTREPLVTGRVMFLGNSITEFGSWQKLLNDPSVINRGIAGDNTFGVLARLKEIAPRRPSKLFIEIGINDFSLDVPLATTLKNILTIVKQVHMASPATSIYVMGIFPTNDNVQTDYPFALNKGRQINQLNSWLKKDAQRNDFIYAGFCDRLKDKNGKLLVKYARPDGIHLNDTGYQLWGKFLRTKGYL
jgi:lysophospholipase L1-like esterase